MKSSLNSDGYSIRRAVVGEDQLALFCEEAERVASVAGSSCVRHLRRRSELFDELAHSESVMSLLPPDMIAVRSILFDKNEKENWSVAWHQDLTIAVASRVEVVGYSPWSMKDNLPHVQPPSELLDNMVTIRLHLDETPSENGALRVIPKSHLLGKIPTNEVAKHLQNQEVICECLAGDVLLMKPLILHSSRRSEFPLQRRVVHIEYARAGDLPTSLQWAEQVTVKSGED
ncbi:MAG: ectoine hydroxylase-related dioxygenase (phytanoyl-CoA dioxygenase family) [Cryomorphaceae bacterium]|jgi:ectoine hydroxylase-related dioxygenase (phytanoyl-CoA dioxygenase family)